MAKRNLYLKTVSVDEAINKYIDVLTEKNILSKKSEIVNTEDALNRVTSEAVFAKCNSPLFSAAAMDGICVEANKTNGASEENPIVLELDNDYKVVDTGDVIKSPYDAVIMAEDVIEVDDTKVKITEPVPAWQHVRPIGEDIVKNEMILPTNHKITPIDIGALLAGGILNINCIKNINVAVIPTGDEIINPKDEPSVGDIIDSNSYMIKALVENMNAKCERYDIVKDDYDMIKNEVLDALSKNDMVILNAGSSAGRDDYTVHILKELGDVVVHGVSMKPGKPVILAVINNKPVIGLPGYPLSAYLAFNLFVKPVIEKLQNIDAIEPEYIDAIISKRIVSSLKHREYIRVKVGKVEDKYIAAPLNRGAASQMSMVRADGLLIIPQNSEGVEAGDKVHIELLKNKKYVDNTLVCIGSHDILLDIVSDIMEIKYEDVNFSSTHVGSTAGLMALKRNETMIVPTHLLDEKTGVYNIPILKELFGNVVDNDGKQIQISLIKGFKRIQGIVVKKGNPLNINSLSDLTKYKFVNRQRGSGTRVLLDYKLKQLNINPNDINGYTKEMSTHMAVCAAVASGEADCGLAIKPTAKVMDLDFIEVGVEEYDFALYTKYLNDYKIQKFLEVIKSSELHKKLDELGGYGYDEVGTIVEVI